jgi:putative hydrolase of the HAD superfamily
MTASRQVIQAVTFDVGGTLITPHPSVGAVYLRVAENHGGTALTPDLLERRFQDAWFAAQPFSHTRADWQRLVDHVFDGLIKPAPSTTFFDELYSEFGRASAWQVFDDVFPTLDALAALGVDLGIVSNWDERLRPLLEELRLSRYFNCIVISCETGFTKPSPVAFEEALRQLGRPASAVLHVGDGLAEDFSGARAAGLAALHLRRDRPSKELQIHSLHDLLAALRRPEDRQVSHDPGKFLLPDD